MLHYLLNFLPYDGIHFHSLFHVIFASIIVPAGDCKVEVLLRVRSAMSDVTNVIDYKPKHAVIVNTKKNHGKKVSNNGDISYLN